MKRIHYCSLRVEENTLRMAKELAARAGMPMKEFVKLSLEMSREQNADAFKKRKQIGFDFRL